VASGARIRLQTGGRLVISSILGEWREDKVRPIPGNAPHDRPVSRVISPSSESICDDSFSTTRFPQLTKTPPGPWVAFSRHDGIYRSDVVIQTKPAPGSTASRQPTPTRDEERGRRTTFFPSSAMSSGRLFLDRVARQHGPSPLHRHTQTNMQFLSTWQKDDISTLPGTRHFYFALTQGHNLLDFRMRMKYSNLPVRL
jgi:hypothetical protein